MAAAYDPYKDRRGKWRWRLFAANGLVVATGNECFSSRGACLRGIDAVKAIAATAKVLS